jgi:GAF domain-containing protein
MFQKTGLGYYHALYEVAAAVSSARTPDRVLQSIVESVARTLGAKGCSLMLLTPDRKLLLHTAACGLSDWYVRKGPVSADVSIAEALEGKAVAVLDAIVDARVQYREQAAREGIASILSVPMMLRDEIVGVVRVYSAQPRHFTDEDIYFVGVAGRLGAIALENARLYDAVQKDYDDLRRDVAEWRAALGWEWMAGEVVAPAEE